MLIGITGKKGHGKDTVGGMLIAKGFVRVSFADPLKEMLRVGLGLTRDQTDGPIWIKEAIDYRYGKTPREMMQTLGTEWGRNLVGEDVWVKAALSRAEGLDRVVITDVRYPNEAAAIRAAGGRVWKVIRPGVASEVGSEHPSELGIDQIEADLDIINEGTLADLEDLVDTLAARFA